MSIRIIQGGMGVGVSDWRLARAVSQCGQLGVVSGTGVAVLLLRKLQLGDVGGHIRRALMQFPDQDMAHRIWKNYYIAGGKSPDTGYRSVAMPTATFPQSLLELTIVAAFVEIFLAKESHDGVVGINLLEKVQTPTLPTLFGAMLAGVDYVLMGAGIPRHIPGVLDALARWTPISLKLDVAGLPPEESVYTQFDPAKLTGISPRSLKRPAFLAIVSSATLAMTLARKSNGKVEGFVVEGATAGGHNAPPRGQIQLSSNGEPIYGPRDEVDLAKIRELGLPFWLAGGYGTPEKMAWAIAQGAQGVQIGTAFAFCEESAICDELKRKVIAQAIAGTVQVVTDPKASPTGYPFKVLRLNGTLSESDVYGGRKRFCDLGYMRQLYHRQDGTVGYRCPAEPAADYLSKEGSADDLTGRKCLCNALFSTIGLGQQQGPTQELPIITAGDDAACVTRYLKMNQNAFHAADVVEYVLNTQHSGVDG